MSRNKGFTVDKSKWTRMKKNLTKGLSEVQVGWFEGQMHSGRKGQSDIPMAQLAQWVEEGQAWQGQPARPAIRTLFIPVVAEADEVWKDIARKIDAVAQGMMTWKVLHVKLAPKLVTIMKASLKAYQTVPNKPATVEYKGFNDPWVETGMLIDAVRFKVTPQKFYSSRNYSVQTMKFM